MADVKSETKLCQAVRLQIGKQRLIVVDTPGFDDTEISDSDILDRIVEYLVLQYTLGIQLKGIIYMHRITDNRMQGTALRYFEMFKRLCGEENFGNIFLLTTMWSELKDEGVGLAREQELRDEFWHIMQSKGSQVRSYDGSKAMAESIVCRLVRMPSIVLDIQRELVDQQLTLEETKAGRLMLPKVEQRLSCSAQKIEELDTSISKAEGWKNFEEQKRLRREREDLAQEQARDMKRRQRLRSRPGREIAQKVEKDGQNAHKWRDRVTMFASLLGVAMNVTVNFILPFAFGIVI